MDSIGSFLAELFFMGLIFAGVIFLLRYVLNQTVETKRRDESHEHSEFFPLLEKHQERHIS